MFIQKAQSFRMSYTAFGKFIEKIVKRVSFLVLPLMLFYSSGSFGQTFSFPTINTSCPGVAMTSTVSVSGVQIKNSWGTGFIFELLIDYNNVFTGPIQSGNFWDYKLTLLENNPNFTIHTFIQLNYSPNGIPVSNTSSGTVVTSMSFEYTGSLSAMGLTANTTYTIPEVIALFGFYEASLERRYGCYEGTVTQPGAPLPVTLSSFTVNSTENKTVELNWTTADETDNSGFDVEHSLDAKSWSKLGFVETKAAAGNSSTDIQYSFLHSSPHLGQNYYRLIQYDYDGTSTPSIIRSINVISSQSVVVYPNPVVDIVRISVKDEIGKVSEIGLTDASGKDIKKLSSQTSEVNLSGLSSGVYYLYLLTDKGTVYKKLFKN